MRIMLRQADDANLFQICYGYFQEGRASWCLRFRGTSGLFV